MGSVRVTCCRGSFASSRAVASSAAPDSTTSSQPSIEFPRIAGGKLPLFVVVGKDGNVAAYHAGLYEVKATEGLAELERVVDKVDK